MTAVVIKVLTAGILDVIRAGAAELHELASQVRRRIGDVDMRALCRCRRDMMLFIEIAGVKDTFHRVEFDCFIGDIGAAEGSRNIAVATR